MSSLKSNLLTAAADAAILSVIAAALALLWGIQHHYWGCFVMTIASALNIRSAHVRYELFKQQKE
jgi:hypothetical protein